MLQRLPAYPATIVFAVGSSRAGKSTIGNELLGGVTGSENHHHHNHQSENGSGNLVKETPAFAGFNIGHSFNPVTDGVDVAALVDSEKQRILLYCDCEGSFHPTGGKSCNAFDLGAIGLLAYCCADWLMHVSLGNIDERDVENLAYLASAAKKHVVAPRSSSGTV